MVEFLLMVGIFAVGWLTGISGALRYASGGYVRSSKPMPLVGERGCDFCIRKSDV